MTKSRNLQKPHKRNLIKFDDDAKAKVLAFLEKHGTRELAANAGGVEGECIRRRLRTKMSDGTDNPEFDPEFSALYERALDKYRDSLEEEIHRRAVEGWIERPVSDSEGNIIGHVKKYSDRLLELHAKRHIPEYRDKVQIDQMVAGSVEHNHQLAAPDLTQLDREGRAALRTVLSQLTPGEGAPPQLSADITDAEVIDE